MLGKRAAAGLVVFLAALVSTAAGSPPASASDTVACALDGETQSISPPMYIQGGSGTLSFSAQGACSVNGGTPVRTSALASGTYLNSVCGSFTTYGSMDLYIGGVNSGGPHYASGFHIDVFYGGVGGILIHSSGIGNGGVAHMMPAQLGTDGITCARQLLVKLAFEGSL
jgi:hypothetical protein